MDLFSFANQLDTDYSNDKLPPVEKWHPENCGALDIFIDKDGRWFYMKTPIGRAKIVRLFSTLLRLDADGEYYLVTPAEKIQIQVADVPFIITNWEYEEETKTYTLFTLTADKIQLDANNKLELGADIGKSSEFAQIPYIKVRKNLYARLNRNVYYQLLEQAQEVETQKGMTLMLNSNGTQMPLGFLPSE